MTLGFVPQASYYLAVNKTVLGTPVTLTRPNNVNAYVQGQVYGPAADARALLLVPLLPADAQVAGFTTVTFLMAQTRGPADPALNGTRITLASVPYTTVLGDQAALALNDTDIDNLLTTIASPVAQIFNLNTGLGSTMLNASAGVAGRRAVVVQYTPPAGIILVPGSALGLYLVIDGPYVPAALESFTVYTVWTYPAKVAIR